MSSGQPVRVKTSAGDSLVFKSMDLTEEMGRLFSCELRLLGDDEELSLDDLLGQDMTVEIDLANDEKRYLHGFVSEMQQTGRAGGRAAFTAVLRPWLWFLTRRADCRIFQDMTVRDIIEQIFGDLGFSDYEFKLSGEYRTWEYCVQYRESDFNFISRLMEQEGMYYFFLHEDGKHKLKIVDDNSAHDALPHYAEIPFVPPDGSGGAEERILHWSQGKSVTSGKYQLGAFYFKEPRTDLLVDAQNPHPHALADYEIFDYPGEYFNKNEGNNYVKARLQECQVRYERYRGETDCRGVFAGGFFSLVDHPIDKRNQDYLVVSTHTTLSLGDHLRSGGSALKFHCRLEAMDFKQPFRAERATMKPSVQGPQTAIVTGPSGEEIHTDEYGRVKVQFRWDRYGKSDEVSSCWVRVAQVWAGSGWGGMAIPRVGQEVIVSFIEGDPDRPIVTGRVYNADNMPPYELPGNKTRSTIKSRSTKDAGADNFNEIRFEDKAEAEEMYVHAERDQNVVVENNQTIQVGFDKKDVGDRKEAIFNDRSLEVGRDKAETVGRNKSIQVKGNHGEGVGGNMTITVARNLTESVAINYAEQVGAAMELTVGGALAETVGANKSQRVGANNSLDVGNDMTVKIGKSLAEDIGENYQGQIQKDAQYKIGGLYKSAVAKEYSVTAKKFQFVAQDTITIKAGSAQIELKKNGDITIKGKKINVKGSSDLILKGSKIKEN